MDGYKTKSLAYDYLGKNVELNRILVEERSVPESFKSFALLNNMVERFDRSKTAMESGDLYMRVEKFSVRKDGVVVVEFSHSGKAVLGGISVTCEVVLKDKIWTVTRVKTSDP